MEEGKPQSTVREARKAIRNKMFGYIAAGLGFVAGLAWNDAIKVIIDVIVPDVGGNEIVAKLIYAVTVTVVVGLVLFFFEKSMSDEKK